MAPLLGRRPFPLVKPLSEAATGEGEEEVYMIEHSKEAFRSRECLYNCEAPTDKSLDIPVIRVIDVTEGSIGTEHQSATPLKEQ